MKSIARRIIAAAVTATTRLLARWSTNAGHLTTVAQYLRDRGVSDEWLDHWGPAFGNRASRNYRKTNGRKPHTTWEIDTNGKPRRHNAYPTTEQLDEAFTHYAWHPDARLGEAIYGQHASA